ncbi:Uncharacterized conserved protein [Ceraceosorus bombacis]|uniref:Uncharacterized conserved protein n=1 Tax=Ceraceosorus bombacis TaxID=401625 RepID=A0A0P1BB97_9BASI|nr:Uncharacterized conserved protein [Ceraceosorus bombacis]
MSFVNTELSSEAEDTRGGRGLDSRRSSSAGFPEQVFAVLNSVPQRIGSRAKGAASYITAGIPAGRGTLQLSLEAVQMFEARHSPASEPTATRTMHSANADAPTSSIFADYQRSLGRSDSRTTPLPSPSVSRTPLSRSSSSTVGSQLASPREKRNKQRMSSIENAPSVEWLSFSATSPTMAPPLLRSKSASKIATMASTSLSGWTDRWADWALEPFPSSDFSSDTGWAREGALGQAIPESARLIALPGVTAVELGLTLAPNLDLTSPDSVHVKLDVAEMTIGIDALSRVLGILESRKAVRRGPSPTSEGAHGTRSQTSKHIAQQRAAPMMHFIRALGSASIAVPRIRMLANLHPTSSDVLKGQQGSTAGNAPASLQLCATMCGLSFRIRTSQTRDPRHRHWLGSCGVLGKAPAPISWNPAAGVGAIRKGLGDRFRWAANRARVRYVELRRAFSVEASMTSFEALVGIDGQPAVKASQVLYLQDAIVAARSSWTPFGLVPKSADNDDAGAGSYRYFQGDLNEQTCVVEASLGRVNGGLSLTHATALTSTAVLRTLERKQARKKHGLKTERPDAPNGVHIRPPRLIVGVEVNDVSFHLDAPYSEVASKERHAIDSGLICSTPRLLFTLQASYVDQQAPRTEPERRAAWKAHFKRQRGVDGVPTFVEEASSAARERRPSSASMTPGSATFVQASEDDAKQGKGMTMEEALAQMRRIQAAEQGGTDLYAAQQEPARARRRSSSSARRSRASSNLSHPNVRYVFDASFALEPVEAFLVVGGEGWSSRRRHGTPFAGRHLPNFGITRHHLVMLSATDVNASGSINGFEHPSGEVDLSSSGLAMELRCALEELDVDLWQPTVLSTIRRLSQAFSDAVPNVPDQARHQASDGETAQPAPAGTGRVALVERVPASCGIYVSIGTIIAHMGGSDPNCDPHMSRGVGFEAKRVVFEALGGRHDPVRAELGGGDWGARSALQLPEDLTMSVNALAARHGRAAAFKLSLFEIGLFPLLDAAAALAQHMDPEQQHRPRRRGFREASTETKPQGQGGSMVNSPSIFAPAVWDFQKRKPQVTHAERSKPKFRQQDRSNFIFWMPFSATKIFLRPPGAVSTKIGKHVDELTICSEGTRLLAFKIELLHTYCLLVALHSLKQLIPEKPKKSHEMREHEQSSRREQELEGDSNTLPSVHVTFDITDIHVSVALPSDVNLFLSLRRLDFRYTNADGASLAWESLMGAVESPKQPKTGLWEEAVRLRDWKIAFRKHQPDAPRKEDSDGHGHSAHEIVLNGDAASLRIPFDYAVHPIIDNTTVAVKATKQLIAQFLQDKKESVIFPVAEGPKRLPYISVNIRILTIEAQDDPIETRLNMIWRAGGDENQARMERDVAFSEKVAGLQKSNAANRGDAASTLSFNADSMTSTDDSSLSEVTSTEDSDAPASFSDQRRAASSKQRLEIEEARARLDAFNASSWIRRCTNAKAEQARREEVVSRRIYGRYPPKRQNLELPITMAPVAKCAPLFRSSMSRISLQVSPPTFSESQLKRFIHDQGKGVPEDLEYSLLLPMHLIWRMAEWRFELRDYPIPLLHVPPVHHDQPAHLRGRAWDFESDIVLAEQLGGEESIRHVPAVIVPAATGHAEAKEYGISVPKMAMPMAMPVKFYGSPTVNINTSYPTRAGWGQSMQPAIHDVTRVFDSVTSPPHDPSPRIGFWDKLPLIVHGRFRINFIKDGELHLYLKGSRDPYSILGHGSGWVMCWRGNVDWRLGDDNPQGEFFQVRSEEFLLAIPDLRSYIDQAATGAGSDANAGEDETFHKSGEATLSSQHRYKDAIDFRKIVLKLTDGVRWGLGIVCERTCRPDTCPRRPKCTGSSFYRECRFFDAKPHWEVHTRSREYMETLPENQRTDSYAAYRTDHVHFSMSIISPASPLQGDNRGHPDLQRSRSTGRAGQSSNNFYFTPLAWEHFWAWMRLFNGALGLPIRQGSLFPEAQAQSPKFGRHLATLKYRFDLSPLFITHLYPQNIRKDWAKGKTTLYGIKSRIATFHLDMHQRQQEMLKERPELGERKKVFHKPFYEAEVDLDRIDLRTLCGQFTEPDKRLYASEGDEYDSEAEGPDGMFADYSFPDEDLEWWDLRDFVEVDWSPPDETEPRIKLSQALACPHFNYYRRLESKRERRRRTGSKFKDPTRSSTGTSAEDATYGEDQEQEEEDISRLEYTKFGRESSHCCLVGRALHPDEVQRDLCHQRLQHLQKELDIAQKLAALETHERKNLAEDPDLKVKDLRKKVDLISNYVNAFSRQGKPRDRSPLTPFGYMQESTEDSSGTLPHLYSDWESFNNRFLVHNPTIYFSNETRDVLLKYYLSSRARRAIVHHLTARAVRYIRGLSRNADDHHESDEGDDEGSETDEKEHEDGDEQDRNQQNGPSTHAHRAAHQRSDRARAETVKPRPGSKRQSTASRLKNGTKATQRGRGLLRDLLSETTQHVIVDSPTDEDGPSAPSLLDDDVNPGEGISDFFEVRRSNVCVLIKPQIVLKSEVDDKSSLILTAVRLRLQNFSVIDPTCEEDSVNERALYRNFASLDGLQAFHPSKMCASPTSENFASQSATVPLETLLDLKYETSDFARVAPSTDASVQYDKFNKLRLNDSAHPVASDPDSPGSATDHLIHHMDLMRVKCPRFAVLANSAQFGALYNVVTDLLLHRDPAYREHSKRLEAMLFSHDFSNVSGLAELVSALQVRVRHAMELHAQYLMHFEHLNQQGRLDFLTLKTETQDLIDELTLIMEAIAASEDQGGGSDQDKKSALRLEAMAQDITWSMMGEQEGQLLAKLSVKGASFTWLNKTDNSAANTLSIADMAAVNVHPDAFFPEIIAKYNKAQDHPMAQQGRFLDAMWSVLAPVGGIQIMEQFEFNLHPLRIQLELKVGRKIMDYVFGSKRERERKDREQRAIEEERRESAGVSKRRGRLARFTRNLLHSQDEIDKDDNRSEAPRRVGTPGASSARGSTERGTRPSHSQSSRDLMSRPSTPAASSRHQSVRDSDSDDEENGLHQHGIVMRNAAEMRGRAATNRTFVYVKIPETVFNLSFKGDKEKSITDLFDLVFHTPSVEYRNRTWGFVDLANQFKRDIIRAAWGQKTSILRGVLNARPRKPSIRAHLPARLIGASSSLHLSVEPPTPDVETRARSTGRDDALAPLDTSASALEPRTNGRARDSMDSFDSLPAFTQPSGPYRGRYDSSASSLASASSSIFSGMQGQGQRPTTDEVANSQLRRSNTNKSSQSSRVASSPSQGAHRRNRSADLPALMVRDLSEADKARALLGEHTRG